MVKLLISIVIVAVLVGGYFFIRDFLPDANRSRRVLTWLENPDAHPDWAWEAGKRCAEAPFLLPTSGLAGYLWGDSFRPGHRHQGIDIFGGEAPGETPVLTAYSGYLTRLPDWKSSVIIRIPQDPLNPDRQIWIYYTHMADKDGKSFISEAFPAGTTEMYVEAGVLLGYQGNYSGDPFQPTGVHLHFSIVLDQDGRFRNELEILNTLDPSPYFGLPLNASTNQGEIPVCPDLNYNQSQ